MGSRARRAILAMLVVCAAGCTTHGAGGGYTVSGTVSGLASGQQLALADNGSDTLSVAGNGAFTFKTSVAFNSDYSVTVAAPPAGQSCVVTHGAGSSFEYNISNVVVVCSNTAFSIGGTVTGLAPAAQLSLKNNGNDLLTVDANGTFNFAISLTYQATYAVTVSEQPPGQTCAVAMGSGMVTGGVSNIVVTCAYDLYAVGGTVSGLPTNAVLKLLLNGGDTLRVTANGSYTFTSSPAYGSPFAVTITGNPPVGQTCAVQNGAGTVSSNVTVAVQCTNVAYTVGGALSGLAPFQRLSIANNGANPLVLTANGSFTFPTRATYNAPFVVTISGSQPTGESCSVQMGSGTVTMNVSTILVNCVTPPQFAYAVNTGGPDVALFSMNAGQLTTFPPATATASTGTTPQSIALDPLFEYAYVANTGDGTVSLYSIGTDGSFAPLSPPTVATGNGPQFVTVSPLGNAAYVLNGPDATISQYSRAGGLLSPLATPTVASGVDAAADPIAMAIDSAGAYAYVVNQGDNSVTQFSIAPADGSLTAVSTTATGISPSSVALDPKGPYLYVTNKTDNTVWQYSIGAGGLTALSAGPVATGNAPSSVVVDPTGAYVYVTNSADNTVSQYTIAGGALTAIGAPSLPQTGASPYSLAFDQTGAYLFCANSGDGSVSEFVVGSGGALTSTGSISAGSSAVSIATAYPHP
jgi:6-phosphogluconolactonase (cycloisomerase 2 family)